MFARIALDLPTDEQTEAINRQGVEAVSRAVGDAALVMASCGPSGKILKPYGDVYPDDVLEGYEY